MISVVFLSVLAVFASSSQIPSDPFQSDCSCPTKAPASGCQAIRCLGTSTASRTPIVGSCVDNGSNGCKCAEVVNGASRDLVPALCGKCCDIRDSLGGVSCSSVYCKAAVLQNNMKRCAFDGAQKCSCGSPNLESCPTTSTTADPTTSTSTTKTTTTKTTTTRTTTMRTSTTTATTTTGTRNCCSIINGQCSGSCDYVDIATGTVATSGCIGDSQKCDCRIPTTQKLITVEKKCKCCDAKDYYTCRASTCSLAVPGTTSSTCKWSSGACMCANGGLERGCPATTTTSSPQPQCRSCKARFLASGVCSGKCYYTDSSTLRKVEGKCVSGITKCECRKIDGSFFSPNIPVAVEQCACCEAKTAAQCRFSRCANPLVSINGQQVSQPYCLWDERRSTCGCANQNGEPSSICDPATSTPTTTADPTTTVSTSTTKTTSSVTSTRTTNDGVCGCPAYTNSRLDCTTKNCELVPAAGIANTLVQCELTGKTVSDSAGSGLKYECICPAKRLNAQAAPCDCCGRDERLCTAGTCSKTKGATCVWDTRKSSCFCASAFSSTPTADDCPTTTTRDPRTTSDPTTTTSDPTTTSATSDPATTTTRTTHPPATSDGVCGCPDRLASGDKCERHNCDVVKLGLSAPAASVIKQCQTKTTTVNGVAKTSCVCPTFQNTYLPKPCDCCGRTQQVCELGQCSKNSNAPGGRCKWKSATSGTTVAGECVCVDPNSSAEFRDHCPTSPATTTKDPNHTTRTDKTTTTKRDHTTTRKETTTTKSDVTTTRDGSQTTTTKNNPNQSTTTKDPNQQTTRATTKDPGSQTTKRTTDAATTKDPATTTKTDRTTTRSDKTTTTRSDKTTTTRSDKTTTSQPDRTTTVKPDTTTKNPGTPTTTAQRTTVATRPCQDPAPTAPVIALCNCPKQKDPNRPCTDYQTKVQGFLTNNYPSTYYARCEVDGSSAGDCKPPAKYTVTTNGNSQTIDVKPVPCTCCGILSQRRCLTTGVVVGDSAVSTCKYWRYCRWIPNADGTGKCDNPKPLASCQTDRPPTPNNPTTTTAAPVLFIVVVKGQISCSLNPVRTTGEPALTTTDQACSMPFRIAIQRSFGTTVKGAYYIGIEVCKKDPSKTSATDITITYYIVCSSESQIEQIKKLVNGWLTRYQTLQDLFLKYTNQALVCKADAAPQCYERSSTGVVSSTAGTGKCKALLNVLTSASPSVSMNVVALMIIAVFGILV